MAITLPVGRRKLRLWGFTTDDRRTEEEYQAALARAQERGYKPPKRERMPQGRWNLTATIIDPRVPPRPPMPRRMDKDAFVAWDKEHPSPERHVGTILKGWYMLGWSRYRFKWWSFELAVGGEDSMVQVGIRSPLLAGGAGFRVPRRWLRGWVYERRSIIEVKLGYMGSIAHVALFHDDRMDDMRSYYLREREQGRYNGFVTPAMLRNGWAGYVGGTHIWERQVVSRVFGAREYTTVRSEPVPVTIRMPEGDYPATVTVVQETWKRPRAWWSMKLVATDTQVPNPPQFAGKGENSWDCGDDGYYASHSRSAKTVEDAVEQYRLSVLDERKRHGMPAGLRA